MRYSLKTVLPAMILILACAFFTGDIHAQKYPWAFGFQVGMGMPIEEFNDYLDDDTFFEINAEYMSFPYLGVRVAYGSHEFDIPNSFLEDTLNVDTFSVSALVAYSFPKYLRLFAMGGPCYYYSRNQEYVGLGDDSKDIGWVGGAGFEVIPAPRWINRFQSVYHSANLGNNAFRTSWVDTSAGLAFRF